MCLTQVIEGGNDQCMHLLFSLFLGELSQKLPNGGHLCDKDSYCITSHQPSTPCVQEYNWYCLPSIFRYLTFGTYHWWRIWAGPFLGDLTIPGASFLGRTMLSIFCSVISAAVFTLGSSIRLRYWAGTFTCTGDYCCLQNHVKGFFVGNLAQR